MAARIRSAGSSIRASNEGTHRLPPALPARAGPSPDVFCAVLTALDSVGPVEAFLRVLHRLLRRLLPGKHLRDLGKDDGVALVPLLDLRPEPYVLRLPRLGDGVVGEDVRHLGGPVLRLLDLRILIDGLAGGGAASHLALEAAELGF